MDTNINRGEGVEAYYQIGKENILVYNRADNELVIGNAGKEIQTIFKPQEKGKYVDDRVSKGELIKLKG